MKNKICLKAVAAAGLALLLLAGCSANKSESSSLSEATSNTASQSSAVSSESSSSSGSEVAVTYKEYSNSRFGFSMEYPSFLKVKQDSDNGDGRIFASDDGTVNLTVSGANNVGNLGNAYSAEDYLKEMMLPSLKNVSYKEQKSNWCVVSWSDGDYIGYEKAVVGKGSVNEYLIKYPASRKAEFDAIIAHLNKTFKTPDIDDLH